MSFQLPSTATVSSCAGTAEIRRSAPRQVRRVLHGTKTAAYARSQRRGGRGVRTGEQSSKF